jgi:glutamate carboxypeptidase
LPDPWVASGADAIAQRAERELDALVAVSTPSGDVAGAEEAITVIGALLPPEAQVERVESSSPGHARDLLVRLAGSGDARLLLLGHLDTVVAHAEHRPLERRDDRLVGSGAIDMKGGLALALGVVRVLASVPETFREVALLVVCDEEWRTEEFVHGAALAAFDACLCFEAGELGPAGEEGVVVRRKAAGTLRVRAEGASAHSGSAPDRGRNALLALAEVAQRVAAAHDPDGPDRLTAVPTVVRSGDAFNVVPATGELYCDLRADGLEPVEDLLESLPSELLGGAIRGELVRRWPSMDTREATADLLRRAGGLLGRPISAAERGGASDASHFAAAGVKLTIDGLGPRGGGAHAPSEFVLASSLRSRAEVALAVCAALLGLGEAPGPY